MSPEQLSTNSSLPNDELAEIIADLKRNVREEKYQEAEDLFRLHAPAIWFGLPTGELFEIFQVLSNKLENPSVMLQAWHKALLLTDSKNLLESDIFAELDLTDSEHLRFMTVMRMFVYRLLGHPLDALEQGNKIQGTVTQMQPVFDLHQGWNLLMTVQVAVTAIQAGDFKLALALLSQAHMHVEVPQLRFLHRDALIKAALVHSYFGDMMSTRSLIQRADRIARTSSWAEKHIDAHRDMAIALSHEGPPEEALDLMDKVELHDVGEMWPFFIAGIHRLMEAAGYRDELENRLETFDSMPFPRQDRQGFTGSVIPLRRAMLALDSGRFAEAQELISKADPNITFTKLITAASNLYAGRTRQALQEATLLSDETKGLRQMELRRLSIMASCQYRIKDLDGCEATLSQTVNNPRGLTDLETQYFSPEVRNFALRNIPNWNKNATKTSVFLANLPEQSSSLTPRELEIVQVLSQGLKRAEMAQQLFVSVNTLKTQLRSIYRKLDVSSGSAAVIEAQRRGLI